MKKIILVIGALVVLVFVYWVVSKDAQTPIGGDRDDHGCLIAAGYSYSEEVGACLREFDMTPDIKQAAQLAVQHAGQSYALTVISFNSYEEPGAYDITLEKESGYREMVVIKNWEVVESQ